MCPAPREQPELNETNSFVGEEDPGLSNPGLTKRQGKSDSGLSVVQPRKEKKRSLGTYSQQDHPSQKFNAKETPSLRD